MSANTLEQVLVVLTTPPTLEAQVVDWLLSRDAGTGFSSLPVYGHSSRHDHLSVAEQVSGRQRRLQFQVQIDNASVLQFIGELVSEFSGADIHYFVHPVLVAGRTSS